MTFILIVYREGWERQAREVADYAARHGVAAALVRETGWEGPAFRVLAPPLEASDPDSAKALVDVISGRGSSS